jgi:hypothetical protein
MILRHVCAGLVLVASLAVTGCCCWGGRSCGYNAGYCAPSVVNSSPCCAPAAEPCCGPTAQAYSSPAPCCASLRK